MTDRKLSVYALLNRKAKAWWWHAQLRREGRAVEARALERESIKSSLRTIRAAWMFKKTGSGFAIEYGHVPWTWENSSWRENAGTLSGHDDGEEYEEALKRCRPGVARINTRTIPEHRRVLAHLCGPMPRSHKIVDHLGPVTPAQLTAQHPQRTYSSFEYMPLYLWLAFMEAAGAEVRCRLWSDSPALRVRCYHAAQPTIETVFHDDNEVKERLQAGLQYQERATSMRAEEDDHGQ